MVFFHNVLCHILFNVTHKRCIKYFLGKRFCGWVCFGGAIRHYDRLVWLAIANKAIFSMQILIEWHGLPNIQSIVFLERKILCLLWPAMVNRAIISMQILSQLSGSAYPIFNQEFFLGKKFCGGVCFGGPRRRFKFGRR